jgi:nitroreductase
MAVEETRVETKLLHLGDIPISSGLPKRWSIRSNPSSFGVHEGRLGKLVGMTQLASSRHADPGMISSLRHWHEAEDEFVYVLEGKLLLDENGAHELSGLVRGFPLARPMRTTWPTCPMRRFLAAVRAARR